MIAYFDKNKVKLMFFAGLLSFVAGLLVGGLFGADKIDAIHPGEGIGISVQAVVRTADVIT